ncbi:ligand-gated ion channel [Simiduia litorea]
MNAHEIDTRQLVDHQAVVSALDEIWMVHPPANDSSPLYIKTGLFIQSLNFSNSSDVNLSGYLWQHYEDGVHDAFKPAENEAGFIFPEQVMTGSDIPPSLAYRYKTENGEVLGWYFEATLRQNFDYDKYPFDHKTVWIRLWPKAFSSNLVLVPDFDSYNATGINDTFGIDDSIVLGAWNRENTYFDYKNYSYTTNFGIPDYTGQHNWPELHFNIVIKRKFSNAFTIYLLPLLLVATLLFAALLTVSEDDTKANRLGFNASGFMGACSALFFVVMLAHIQLREKFAAAGVVYIEYFYILMYGLLVAATANTYLFSVRAPILARVVCYQDNLIAKVAYWPILLLSLTAITAKFS